MFPTRAVGKRSVKKQSRALQQAIEQLEERRLLTATIAGSPTVYPTIQSAVNAAPAGATINVTAGTYDETVDVTEPLTINGAEANISARNTRGAESIVYATQTVFYITANDVTINGFTIEGDDANIGAAQGAGVLMAPSIQGTQVLNNIIQNNVTGIYLSNDSNTDQCLIQGNLIQNNFEAGNNWVTEQWNGSRGIYTDGTVSGGYLTNVLINNNTIGNFNFGAGDEDEGIIALQALNPGKQFNITISDNYLTEESKALLATNVTNLTFIGNTVTNFDDGSSGPVRFEGDANTVDIQYNSIYDNSGPGVAADSSGVPGDSSGFVVDNNNIYSNDGIGVLVIANVYDGPLYAQNDYWGSASGPSGDGPGTGQAVWANGVSGHGVSPKGSAGGDAIFSPWATAMINIANIPAPAAPSAVSLSGISASSVTLNWTAPMSTAINQLVERSTDGVNWTTIAIVPPLLNSYTDTSFNSSSNYYYRVVASNFTGQSPASNVATYRAPTAPAAPILSAAALSASQIQLYWTPGDATATSFTLQRSPDGVNYTTIATGLAANSASYLDTGLATNTEYYYRLYADNAVGSSPASDIVPVTTLVGNPTAVPLSSIPWTSATAGWGTVQLNQSIAGNPLTLHGVVYPSGIGTHASSTITYSLDGKYNTFVSDVGLDAEEIGVGSGAVDFQVIGDGKVLFDSGVLTPSSPTVHIAVSVAGVQTLTLQVNPQVAGDINYDHSDWAGAELLVDPAIPTAPTAPANLAAIAIGSASINLTWSATSTNQTSFTILRSTDGSNFAPIATGVAANSTTYTDSANLAAGTEYYYEVEAVSSAGASPASNIASATTAALSPIVTPLSSIPWTSATAGWGTVQLNQSIAGNPLTLHGVVYPSGIGTHASSTITYSLAGKYNTFVSDVGLDAEEIGVGSGAVDFQVIGDGKVLFDSGVLTPSSPTVHIAVSVAGVQTLTLQVNPQVAGDIDYDHSDWAGAELLVAAAIPTAPTAPANLAALATGQSSINLTWSATSTNQTSFTILRSTDGSNFAPIATGVAANSTTYTDAANLATGTEYYYEVEAVNSVASSAPSNIASAATAALAPIVTPLSSIPWTSATAGWGTVQLNQSIKDNPLTLHGVVYPSGIGTHASSTITYNLGGQYTTFISDVGLDDEEIGVGSGAVDFQVIGDGKVLFDSGVLTPSSPTVHIAISVAGVQTLTLQVNPQVAGDIDYDHSDWAGAELLSTPAAPIAPANLTATPMGSTSVKLTWTASPGATSYQVDRSTDGVNWTTVATSLSGSLTSWIDTAGIQASTEYYFRVRAVNSIGTSSNSNVANATTSALDTVTYVSSLPWTTATVGWGTIQENASILGNPITIHGVVYASGIGTHAASNISYSLAGQYTSFLADVGLDDEEIGVGSGAVDFQVIGTTNGVQTVLFDSGVLTPNSPTVSINVSVVGVQTLTLVVNPGIVGTIDYDHADWADARLTV